MKHVIAGSLVLSFAVLLTACNQAPEVPVKAGDACKSLEPVLKALPPDKKIEGVTAIYRGCDTENGNVAVVYATADGTSSYAYNVTVLNPDSPYVESFRGVPENQHGGIDVFVVQTQLRRQKYENQKNECKQQIIARTTDRKKPVIYNLAGMETCMYGLMTPAGRKLQAFAVHGDLGFELIVSSEEAAETVEWVEALKFMTPLFEKFDPKAVP